jgi:transcriptional regulator with XRE-family HTH domain
MAKDLNARIGGAIRGLREERGWSQERLAAEAELNRSYVGGLERGERNPTVATLDRVARALEVPLAEVVAMAERGLR